MKFYLKNNHKYNMPDKFICVNCGRFCINLDSRQVKRFNGGVNYICIDCINKLKEKK